MAMTKDQARIVAGLLEAMGFSPEIFVPDDDIKWDEEKEQQIAPNPAEPVWQVEIGYVWQYQAIEKFPAGWEHNLPLSYAALTDEPYVLR